MACPPDCGFDGDPTNLLREADFVAERGKHTPPAVAAGAFAVMLGFTLPVLEPLLMRFGPQIAAVGAAGAGAGGGAVSVKDAVARGAVSGSGKLVQVLGAIESEAAAANPGTAGEALDVVIKATSSVKLEPGVLTHIAKGALQLKNVGDVVTTLGANGSILVERGKDVLLNIPK